MSKFEIGQEVVVTDDHSYVITKKGMIGVVEKTHDLSSDVKVKFGVLCESYWIKANHLKLTQKVSKQKPAKVYTETDRRKAAKEVRAAQDKLEKLVKKAKETGIKVEFVNQSIGRIDIVMEYQPATPKKRTY